MKGSTKARPKRSGGGRSDSPTRAGAPPDERTGKPSPPTANPGGDRRQRGFGRSFGRQPTSNRDRVLSAWRGVDLRSDEVARALTARPAGEVVRGVVAKLRLDQRQAETEIIKVWNHLIDGHVTAHAQPVGLHKGTLFVNIDSSVWLDEIVRFRRKEILTRLQSAFGRSVIQRISFRLG